MHVQFPPQLSRVATLRGVDHGGLGVMIPLKICSRVQSMPRPPKCHIPSLKTIVGQLCKPHTMKDERLVSKVEGKTNFSRRLKQFDVLARLTPTP